MVCGSALGTLNWSFQMEEQSMGRVTKAVIPAAGLGSCSDIWTLDRADFETYRLPGRKHFKLV